MKTSTNKQQQKRVVDKLPKFTFSRISTFSITILLVCFPRSSDRFYYYCCPSSNTLNNSIGFRTCKQSKTKFFILFPLLHCSVFCFCLLRTNNFGSQKKLSSFRHEKQYNQTSHTNIQNKKKRTQGSHKPTSQQTESILRARKQNGFIFCFKFYYLRE